MAGMFLNPIEARKNPGLPPTNTKGRKNPELPVPVPIKNQSLLQLRFVFSGILLVLGWHSIFVSQTEKTHTAKLQRNLRVLATSVDVGIWSVDLNAERPVHCPNSTICCGRWDIGADRWWIHHPHWEVVSEDDTSFCFSLMQNDTKREFLQRVHRQQWNVDTARTDKLQDISMTLPETFNFTVNCSDIVSSVNINSGFGASRSWLLGAFWFALQHQRPFQTTAMWNWLYAFPNENSTWANCTAHDQSCFYLPISPCSRKNKHLPPRSQAYPDKRNETLMMENRWLQQYMERPNQPLRQQIHRLRGPLEEKLKGGCVGIHVRRGDVAAPQPPYRRYAAVQEYLDQLNNLQANSTIFLLTDDVTTIEEVQEYHAANYNWVYSNKIRVRGVEQGFNKHIPPGSSGPEELAWITVELELLSSYCHTLVYGKSGIALAAIELATEKGNDIQLFRIQTLVPREEITPFTNRPLERGAHLLREVATLNAA